MADPIARVAASSVVPRSAAAGVALAARIPCNLVVIVANLVLLSAGGTAADDLTHCPV